MMAKAKLEAATHIELRYTLARELAVLAARYGLAPQAIVEKGIALMAIALKAEREGLSVAVVAGNGEVVADITGVTASGPVQEKADTSPLIAGMVAAAPERAQESGSVASPKMTAPNEQA